MSSSATAEPNYVALVRFLVTPFLEFPESLVVDCETYAGKQKVRIRLAFAESDKGRVFGRSGRTLHAIRTVVETAGKLSGQVAYLEVYGEREHVGSSAPPNKSSAPRPRPQIGRKDS
ncbi:MAG TPA: KH domain-containing protein [Stenomitos sp.]